MLSKAIIAVQRKWSPVTFRACISTLLSAVTLGASGYVLGVLGPMTFAPEANQGPLLGILILGPGGFILGGVIGGVIAARRQSSKVSELTLRASMAWKKILIVAACLSVLMIAFSSFRIPWHQKHLSPKIHSTEDIENRKDTLEKLEVRFLSDEGIALLGKFEKLRSLDFQSGWGVADAKVTDKGLKSLSEIGHKHLNTILLGYCSKITDRGISFLLTIDSLKCLILNNCQGITDDGLEIISTSSNITKLNLSGCNNITDRGLEFLKRMRSLKSLWLRDCKNLTKPALAELKKSLPNVKIATSYKLKTK